MPNELFTSCIIYFCFAAAEVPRNIRRQDTLLEQVSPTEIIEVFMSFDRIKGNLRTSGLGILHKDKVYQSLDLFISHELWKLDLVFLYHRVQSVGIVVYVLSERQSSADKLVKQDS